MVHDGSPHGVEDAAATFRGIVSGIHSPLDLLPRTYNRNDEAIDLTHQSLIWGRSRAAVHMASKLTL